MGSAGKVAHWDVWRAGSQTFAERVSLMGAPESRSGDQVYMALAPPVWRITDWEETGEEDGAPVYKVWVKRTGS